MKTPVFLAAVCGLSITSVLSQEPTAVDTQVDAQPLIPATPTTQIPNPDPPIVVSRMGLPDQYEQMHEVSFPTPKPVVVTLGDREGSALLSGWVDAISAVHGETVLYMGMADLGEVPKAMRSIVRKAIKKETPNFPVLLDWEGAVSAFMKARPGTGNVFIVDTTGTIRAHFAGTVNEGDLARIAEVVKVTIEEAPSTEPAQPVTALPVEQ